MRPTSLALLALGIAATAASASPRASDRLPRRLKRPATDPAALRVTARHLGIPEAELRRIHLERGQDLAALRKLPRDRVAYLRRRLRKPAPAFPAEAFEYRRLQEQDESGEVPVGSFARGLEVTRRRAAAAPDRVAGVPTGDLRAGWLGAARPPEQGRWRWLGPGNIGGRTRALLFHPDEPGLVFAGSAGGGVWVSRDDGATWFPSDTGMGALPIASLVLDPKDPDRIYAATGEGFFGTRVVPGAGVFVSEDRGRSWRSLPATIGVDFLAVNRLAFTADGARLLAVTPAGVRYSEDRGGTWADPGGPVSETTLLDLACHPTDSRRCVASGRQGDVYWTLDGGTTWRASHGLPGGGGGGRGRRIEVTYAAANPDVVYASVDVDHGTVYRSEDGGRSFLPRATRRLGAEPPEPANYLGSQGWYDNVIWAGDPGDADLVVVGGIDLWRSEDGGDHLEPISRWQLSSESAHADNHVVVNHPSYEPRDEGRLTYFGNDGGVYRSDVVEVWPDAGWEFRSTGYGVTQFYRAAWSKARGTLVGGTQDNGTLRYRPATGPHDWYEFFGGDGGWCAWDPIQPTVFYGEYVFLMLHRSMDDGETADFVCGLHWNPASGITWKDEPYLIPDARDNAANFIAPFALDPHEPARLYAGGASLWRTDDARAPNTPTTGPSWEAVKPALAPGRENPISAVEVVPGRAGEVWIGHNLGELFRGTGVDGAAPSWERLGAGRLPRRFVTGVTFAGARTYVTYGGYSADNVWVSEDRGATWRDVSANLPPIPVKDLAAHPERPAWLYAATSLGVWASGDGGGSWWPTSEGPRGCSVEQLEWIDTRASPVAAERALSPPARSLLAVTYGRGMYALQLEFPAAKKGP